MKTAKEMFEELGYEYKRTKNQIKCTKQFGTITFNLGVKEMQRNYRAYDIPLLKAIITQCEELGWLDE